MSSIEKIGSEPIISVLVLTYNHASYVRQALDSIVSQKVDVPFEILIGDDASVDGTAAILAEYAVRHPSLIRLFAHPLNLGMHANHALLQDQARGRYIAYCEGDDYWLAHDKLQRQLTYMERNPDVGLVHSNYLNLLLIDKCWRVRTAFRNGRQLSARSGWIYEEMLQSNRIQTCTAFCRSSLVADYRREGPGVDGYMVGDWPLFLYLAHASQIGFMERPLAAYRKTPGSLMNSGHEAAVKRGLDAIRMVGDFCDFFTDSADTREVALASQYRVLLWLAFHAGDTQRFGHAWGWLAQHHPALLSSARARAMRILVGAPLLRNTALGALGMIESIKHRIEFRGIGKEVIQ